MNTVILVLVSFAAGAIASYLVLRNNPKVKASVDAAANKGEDLIDRG